jgi:hypothetical protein
LTDTWYVALEPFGPEAGGKWTSYLDWAKLRQLEELVSLDDILCPRIIQNLTSEDWEHNVQEDYLTECFTDLDYLRSRVAGRPSVNMLAVLREPSLDDVRSFADDRFVFQGYDLVEKPGLGGISAISNCGGFNLAFGPADVSPVGLLDDYEFARGVQQRLLQHYPDEHHAWCYLWAVWRMKAGI